MAAESIYREYVAALLRGNRRRCMEIVRERLHHGRSAKSIYLDFIQSSLYEVGERWEHNEISVATEHMATSITEGLLNEIFATITPAAGVGRSVVVAGLAPELHQIGSRIVADIFEMQGWDSHYIGGNTSTQQLLDVLADKKPDLVALSLTMSFNAATLERVIDAVREAQPGPDIIIGGQGLRAVGDSLASRRRGLTYIRSIEELGEVLGARPATRRAPGLEEVYCPGKF